MARITINGITIDPQAQSSELSALGLEALDASSSNYVLIQTSRPLSPGERGQLENAGAKLLNRVPENTYIARFNPSDLSQLRALSFVSWANPYLREFKIAPDLLPSSMSHDLAGLATANSPESAPVGDGRLVDIVLQDDVDTASIRDRIAQEAGVDAQDVDATEHKIRAYVDGSRLARLAAIDDVHHIESVPEDELCDDVALGIMRADIVHASNPSFRGSGQTIAVCDTGFDKGSTTNVHSAFAGRVKKLYALGRSRANDPNGHGTHVAGSALGDGHVATHGPITGTAPLAELVVQSVLDSWGKLGGLPSDLGKLLAPPFQQDGARVHNNSWGSRRTFGRYTQGSKEIDDFVWSNREMVVCFAAGNPGQDANSNGVIDLGSVQAPGTAKNCITVGASENDRPAQSKRWATGTWAARYPAAPISTDLWADNSDGMAAFSGRGPTRDRRIKPDLVAPGTSILSAHSRDASVGNFWGTSPDPDYVYMGGTSMATPLVSGCAAVVREYLIAQQGIPKPSAALVKAALINGCVELPGQYVPSEAGPIPNYNEGFGRVDLARAIVADGSGTVEFHDEGIALDTGDDTRLQVQVPQNSRLKVTLVWTDPPGAGLQNDLDLIVATDTGQEEHGNMPLGSSAFDRWNNVEQVQWTSWPGGAASVVVRAYDIALHRQSFALVIRVD